MRSSMFYLWIISGILGYAHKIPFFGKLITLLSLWYGRTTWWKILLRVRKAFIAFNAVIGMYMVYKSIGFGMDNVLVGISAMGHTYFEIFINFNKKLFNWIFELFDHKIVPNVPNNPPSSPRWPLSIPKPNEGIVDNILNTPKSLREIYAKDGLFNININTTPWYKDLSTWLWIGTIVGTTVGIVGVSYISYIYLADPIINFFRPGPTTNINPPTPEGVTVVLGPAA